mgnify:CR=1 FL=1
MACYKSRHYSYLNISKVLKSELDAHLLVDALGNLGVTQAFFTLSQMGSGKPFLEIFAYLAPLTCFMFEGDKLANELPFRADVILEEFFLGFVVDSRDVLYAIIGRFLAVVSQLYIKTN